VRRVAAPLSGGGGGEGAWPGCGVGWRWRLELGLEAGPPLWPKKEGEWSCCG
jgi:hypothetical protein